MGALGCNTCKSDQREMVWKGFGQEIIATWPADAGGSLQVNNCTIMYLDMLTSYFVAGDSASVPVRIIMYNWYC